MPRILPRLIDKISQQAQHQKNFPFYGPPRRPKSLHRPLPPRPSFNPAHHPRSILLDTGPDNPITSSQSYLYHKTLPPRVFIPQNANTRQGETDSPRTMTAEERRWWANPYLRILSSPMRYCFDTDHHFPADTLIRLALVQLPPTRMSKSQTRITIVPDGVLHPKFAPRRSGRASYIICSREAISQTVKSGSYKRALRGAQIFMNPRLADQIAHLLRLRVLQELELLADRLHCGTGSRSDAGTSQTIIRKLTRSEWNDLKSSGSVPYDDALAILVVPPLNKHRVTKERPEPSMSAMPPEEENVSFSKPLPPLSEMLYSPLDLSPPASVLPNLLPKLGIPLYNGLTAFPNRSQRAALFALLTRLLGYERKMRYLAGVRPAGEQSKASHAFLLRSNADSSKRGDAAAVAIALWRLRMFEGTCNVS
ncbi:uncharacterized protein LACBIDRAFT_311975 [Laccaria bicolor S238N-H82]|uniref:Predicted protein n=1 Tax=Laccaria bicolor (strain S238N-H82 / ATCC MYA-4686) TaxID=486041 RepID=B0CYS3_LACBS|nr:uncharacterized protein LACBIDRAFT_311975 [Laccaria bicolor S238N-H82]EDR12502.1 predicted protein [Laccaria bicolor S238N-H82]|eukprot:XP_001876766.1 predicted protein [Laccaria bicolor S238N-H82]